MNAFSFTLPLDYEYGLNQRRNYLNIGPCVFNSDDCALVGAGDSMLPWISQGIAIFMVNSSAST
jgi:hypothetical protein